MWVTVERKSGKAARRDRTASLRGSLRGARPGTRSSYSSATIVSRAGRSLCPIALKYFFTRDLFASMSGGMCVCFSSVADDDLPEVVAVGEVRERLTCLLEGEHTVDDWVGLVDREGAVHVLEVFAAAGVVR